MSRTSAHWYVPSTNQSLVNRSPLDGMLRLTSVQRGGGSAGDKVRCVLTHPTAIEHSNTYIHTYIHTYRSDQISKVHQHRLPALMVQPVSLSRLAVDIRYVRRCHETKNGLL
mmetsp:Transcript_46095/g.114634  ORF Transcript_46095/g.114634 Transcript_46095/m.114634 type:complete len:112 (+) Transcript_46095:484-819(+)